MVCPNIDFLIDLYEQCLMSSKCPYDILGKKLGNNLGLFAVSIWSAHPHVREAASRIVFFQKSQTIDIVQQDQDLATKVLGKKGVLKGSQRGLCYWAKALQGKYIRSALIVWSREAFSENKLDFLAMLSLRLTVLLDLIHLSNSTNTNQVARELEDTQFIQRQLLPPLNALGGKKNLSYRTFPVHELGGDYLDILNYQDGSVGLTVADAMGKGVSGAFVMLIARTIFRFIASEKIAPHRILATLNNQFIREVAEVDTFVTQFYCVYDPKTRNLVYANAGHNPPIILRSQTGKVTILSGNGIALGGKADANYRSYNVKLQVGDILVIFSDGLLDVRDVRKEQFGLQRIMDTVVKYKEYSADGICDGLMYTIMRHCSTFTDDLSFLVLKVD